MTKFLSLITFRNIVLLLFGLIFLFTFLIEIIPVYGGIGYDGLKYHRIANEGLELLKDKNITGYHVFRFVPFVFYDLLGLSANTKSIIIFYKTFNLFSILAAVIYFFRIASFFKWKETTRVLGFILLFFSFPILKLVNYYPLLTDHFSFALSIAGVFYYLKRNHWGIITILLLSLFNFPTLTFILLLLIITDQRNKLTLLTMSRKHFTSILKIISLIIPGLAFLLFYTISKETPEPLYSGVALNKPLLPYSGIALFLFFTFVVWGINKGFSSFKNDVTVKLNLIYVFIALIIGSFMFWVFNNFPPMPETGMSTLNGFGFRALTMPLNFFVYHVFYFGLFMILSLLFIKSIFKESILLGLGWLGVAIIFYILAIQNESRILLNMLIFIAIPLLQKFDKQSLLSKWKLSLVLIFSLLLSRFYLKLNHTPEMWKLMEDPNEFLKFPVQRYFMNFGPWVSYEMYYVQAGIFLLTFVFAFFLFRQLILPKKQE